MEVQIQPHYNNKSAERNLTITPVGCTLKSQVASDQNAPAPEQQQQQPELTFHCRCCNEFFVNPLQLYQHMNTLHPQTEETQQQADGEEEDNEDYSWVLEPVCELIDVKSDDSDSDTDSDDDDDSSSSSSTSTNSSSSDTTTTTNSDVAKPTKPCINTQDETNNLHINGAAAYSPLCLPNGNTKESISLIMLNSVSSAPASRTPATLPQHNEPKCFQCTHCEASFPNAGDLSKHVRSHITNKPFQCFICGKTFTHIGSLNTHIRIHSGEKPYKCELCSKAFTQSSSLMVHMRSHAVRKPHQCHICEKGFVNSSSLLLHLKTHEDVEAFPCLLCPGKKFKHEALLEDHMRMHTQELVYQCAICREAFRMSSELVQHMKCHLGDKPFTCSICDRSFTQSGSLNIHMRIHTGEKPFRCKHCEKSFTQASSLAVHMRIHLGGDKKLACEICGKTYTHQAHLNRHLQKHAENPPKPYVEPTLGCVCCGALLKGGAALVEHIVQQHMALIDAPDPPAGNRKAEIQKLNKEFLLQALRAFWPAYQQAQETQIPEEKCSLQPMDAQSSPVALGLVSEDDNEVEIYEEAEDNASMNERHLPYNYSAHKQQQLLYEE